MASSNILDTAGTKTKRRRRTQAIVKDFAFHANAKKHIYTSKSGILHKYRNSTDCYGQVKTKKKILKSRSVSEKKACNKQRNKCVSSLSRKIKKAYYSNLNVKNIVHNRKFREP